jgi:transcriptional regulator with XRE-family HTH domain
MSSFSELLKEYRQQRGLSQGQLARAARLSRVYIYHLETGQRVHPSVHTVRALVRALELHGEERRRLYQAFTALTGTLLDEDQNDITLLNLNELASLLVTNTMYPAHGLDRLWYITAWNEAARQLFELTDQQLSSHTAHLLIFLFDPTIRTRFRAWEPVARRLVSDFKYNTQRVTYLPRYRELWRELRQLPDFRRIANSSEPTSAPAPSFAFQLRHSRLGWLTLRTAVTTFSGTPDYAIVSYVPGDQPTLRLYQQHGWQRP